MSYWQRQAFVNVLMWWHRPFESVVIGKDGDWGSVVSHWRRERNRSIHYRWGDPWWLVVEVIPSSICVNTSVYYGAAKKGEVTENIS